jgi:peptide deformylase
MQFDYNEIPEKVRYVKPLNYKKINGTALDVNLEDPDLFNKMQKVGWKMVKTCLTDNGIGLAAPQIGILKKFFIAIDFEQADVWKFNGKFSLYINPVVTPVKRSERVAFPEGCLSVPGKTLNILRPMEVDVSYWYFDKNEKLRQSTGERLDGHRSRLFQHEYGHLFGENIVALHARQNSKPKRGRPKGSKNKRS